MGSQSCGVFNETEKWNGKTSAESRAETRHCTDRYKISAWWVSWNFSPSWSETGSSKGSGILLKIHLVLVLRLGYMFLERAAELEMSFA